MKNSTIREKVVEEVNQIPEERLPLIFDLIHHFRVGLHSSGMNAGAMHNYAGCWENMPEQSYRDFLNDITHRRHAAS